MIKAIIFDFFGVLCTDEYWNYIRRNQKNAGSLAQWANDVNLGRVSWQDFVEKVAKETSQTPEAVEKLYETEQINPALLPLIEKLHGKYKTAVLTNASSEFFRTIVDSTGLDKFFDEIIISSELQMAKPNPKFYEYALNKLGVQANEAVFIDDIEKYVEAAKQLGMQAILYQNFEQANGKLQKILSE
jgi:epoxide hydrolase-like predicted phosphatase